ncbi:MAG: hypothetical protein M1828_006441 [Chrysothrix sp. TS-e1954]|nr:MAG: hypothetical protein M1828_006441 [Chrysothrix sp. TS-e1954]
MDASNPDALDAAARYGQGNTRHAKDPYAGTSGHRKPAGPAKKKVPAISIQATSTRKFRSSQKTSSAGTTTQPAAVTAFTDIPSTDSCAPMTVCGDAINACYQRYGGCYDVCNGDFTLQFPPPPCDSQVATPAMNAAQRAGGGGAVIRVDLPEVPSVTYSTVS